MMRILAIVLILAGFALNAAAQCGCYFAVHGRVTDAHGRPIRGAVVSTLGCVDLPGCPATTTNYARTNTFGYYHFSGLASFEQVLTVWARGFTPFATVIHLANIDTANVVLRRKQDYEIHSFDPQTRTSLSESFGIFASESR